MIIVKDYKIQGECEQCLKTYAGIIDKRQYVFCPQCFSKTFNYKPLEESSDEPLLDLIQLPNKYSNDFCKNKNLIQNKYLSWINIGCRNLSRDGSAWYDRCAEDYKNGVESKFEQPVENNQSLLDNDGASLFVKNNE